MRHLSLTYPKRVLVQVWRLSLHHLNGHDTQRPNVYFRPISLSGHNLRSHPVGRAYHGAALALLWSDLGTEAKVGFWKETGEWEWWELNKWFHSKLTQSGWLHQTGTHSAWRSHPFPAGRCRSWCPCGSPGWRGGSPRPVNTAQVEEGQRVEGNWFSW